MYTASSALDRCKEVSSGALTVGGRADDMDHHIPAFQSSVG